MRADEAGAGSYANVTRAACGQSLLLYFASPPTPTSSAVTIVGIQTPNIHDVSKAPTGSGRRGTQRSGVKEESEGRGTPAQLSAASACGTVLA